MPEQARLAAIRLGHPSNEQIANYAHRSLQQPFGKTLHRAVTSRTKLDPLPWTVTVLIAACVVLLAVTVIILSYDWVHSLFSAVIGFVFLFLIIGPSQLRARELRRYQYAINRWKAGLCPVCKYPRDDTAGAVCPECGRNMPDQASLAADRLEQPSLQQLDPLVHPSSKKGTGSTFHRAGELLTTPNPPQWVANVTFLAASLAMFITFSIMFSGERVLSFAAMIFGLAVLLCLGLVLLVRTRESRRCQYAINRWLAGLCPVCKYPRDDSAGVICPECGRDMAWQIAHAAEGLGRISSAIAGLDLPSTDPAEVVDER